MTRIVHVVFDIRALPRSIADTALLVWALLSLGFWLFAACSCIYVVVSRA